jgi:hypothetical protein
MAERPSRVFSGASPSLRKGDDPAPLYAETVHAHAEPLREFPTHQRAELFERHIHACLLASS